MARTELTVVLHFALQRPVLTVIFDHRADALRRRIVRECGGKVRWNEGAAAVSCFGAIFCGSSV